LGSLAVLDKYYGVVPGMFTLGYALLNFLLLHPSNTEQAPAQGFREPRHRHSEPRYDSWGEK
jgi:hypothetical protein